MTIEQEEEFGRLMLDLSIRYQLQPGRFRWTHPEQCRTMAFMVDAPEWVSAAALVLKMVRVCPHTFAVFTAGGIYRVPVEGVLKMIEDVIERAELGPAEAEYLRGLPRVEAPALPPGHIGDGFEG